MFSLQRLLSRGERFFDLLEASAEEARQSVQALLELVHLPQEQWSLEKFVLRRRQDKQITQEITKQIKMFLAVDNFLDEDYQDLYLLPGRGITAWAGIKIEL